MSASANGNGKLPAGHFEEPVANGKRQLTPEEMRAKTEEMRIVNDYRLACIESNVLLESYGAYGWDRAQGFGGSDTTEFYLRMRQQAGGLAIPPSQPGDRRGGAKWPVWRTDVELNRLRQASRVLCASNDYAKGLLRNQTNYTIGKGFQYKAGPKHPPRPHVDDPGVDQATNEQARKETLVKKKGIEKIVDAVQRWIDDFCARNNWNTSASPHEVAEDGSVGSASSTREREAHWRVDRDGEAIIRLFCREDGKVDVRFVGPEMVWGEPIGKSGADGWSYGMQHLVVVSTDDEGREVRCDDLERICNYYIRPHEIRQQQYDKRHDAGGEIVPAREIVHIKDPWEDAEVKRGTPVFAYDTFDAISRATNLQRNVSITSSVQAATAEIWKHTIGTKSQIESLQNGPLARTVNAGDGAQRVEQRIFPGMIRRVPQGQEPVEYPGSTRVPEYQSAAQGDLRQAGASQSAPEFLVSGDASNGNFASISEAGVPYVRAAESRQEHFKTAFLRLMWRVISYAVKCKALPEEALTVVDIAVEGMEIAKNNEGELATSRAQNLASKVTSPQIECAKLGNDPQQVIADWKEWEKETAPPQQAPGGGPGQKQPGLNPPLGKSFTGVDKDKLGREYHWQNGKRVKAAEKLASAPQEDLSGADVQESLESPSPSVAQHFTGTIKDSLGREYHFVNGKRVNGEQEVSDHAKATGVKAVKTTLVHPVEEGDAEKHAAKVAKLNSGPSGSSPKAVKAKVKGDSVEVVSQDPKNGLVKVKGDSGTKVVPMGYLDFGDDDESDYAGAAPEQTPASEPVKEEKPPEEKPAKADDSSPKHGQRANEVVEKRKALQSQAKKTIEEAKAGHAGSSVKAKEAIEEAKRQAKEAIAKAKEAIAKAKKDYEDSLDSAKGTIEKAKLSHAENLGKAKSARVDAFNSVKADANKAKKKADEHADGIYSIMGDVVWDEGADDEKDVDPFTDLQSAIEDYDSDGTVKEKDSSLKEIEFAAKAAMDFDQKEWGPEDDKKQAWQDEAKKEKDKINGLIGKLDSSAIKKKVDEANDRLDSNGNPNVLFHHFYDGKDDVTWGGNEEDSPTGVKPEEKKQNKIHLQKIIDNARAARTHLKEYVKHRKEMQAIKAGEPMDVQESMRDDGAASDWAALLESMEAPESVHRGQGWLDFGDDDGWVEIRPDGTDLL